MRDPFSSSDDESDHGVETSSNVGKGFLPWAGRLRMSITLVIIHAAINYAKFPISAADVIRWVNRGTIPFLDASRCIPTDLLEHLSQKRQKHIKCPNVPSPYELRDASNCFHHFLLARLQVPLPHVEPQIYLWRLIKDLAIPPWLFPVAMRFMSIVKPSEEFAKVGMKGTKEDPWINCSAVLIFVLKLHYGLASIPYGFCIVVTVN